jgi:hypothetical protein
VTGVLVVNAGSSSLKLRVLGPAGETAALDIDLRDGRTLVITAREDAEIARQVRAALGLARSSARDLWRRDEGQTSSVTRSPCLLDCTHVRR